jgi:hypothetical protein
MTLAGNAKTIIDFNEAQDPWWCLQRRLHLPVAASRERHH